MDMKLFERVCNTPGVSGFEDEAQDVVAEVLKASCDEVSRDRMGNVIGLKKAAIPPAGGKRPMRAILAAHVDEIGAMVKHIDDKGFIRFIQVGALSVVSIISQRVVIHGKKPVRGVVVPDPRPENKDKLPALEDLRIDTGLEGDKLRKLVDIGDIVTFDVPVERLNGKVYVGRNFDNRLGVYCMLEAMRRVGKTRVDAYAVSTVQEEVGIRGIPAAAFAIEPDVGLAIDGSYCWGAYGDEHQKNTAGQGHGHLHHGRTDHRQPPAGELSVRHLLQGEDTVPEEHRRRDRRLGHSAFAGGRAGHHRRRADAVHALDRPALPRRRRRGDHRPAGGLPRTRPRVCPLTGGDRRPRLRRDAR
jgi:endoglucanase